MLTISIVCCVNILYATPLQFGKLTCEYIENPVGIDTREPQLSWILVSDQRNQLQSAYELIVSDNISDIERLKGTIWQTGKVNSSDNLNIQYKGVALKSFTRYYWKVKAYNQNGEASLWSEAAWFETALLNSNDWIAKWIGDGSKQFEKDEDFYKDDPMPLFKKQLNINKKIEDARLYISGLGYYEAYLNDKKIGDHLLDPGFTAYGTEVMYVTYDITPLLINGSNIFGVMLANGWYNPLPLQLFGRFNLRDVQQTGRPCVKAQIFIRYKDGSSDIIATNESWKTAPGPVIRNSVYLGEHYDARLEKSFTSPNNWKTAAVVTGPSGVMTAQMQPPVRITKIINPVSIKEVGRDTFIVDMGQCFAGVARIKVKGKPGQRVSLRYGEDVFKDGRLNYLTTVAGQIKEQWHLSGGPGSPKTAWQQDEYILKGNGIETWSPRFTFHGFRYVEITGWHGTATLNDIEGLRMNSDVQQTGVFACSNDMFNRLHEAIQWTFLSNIFSVQSDCPGREKMGYGGDMVATAEAFICNYDMINFYRKAVQDFSNDQQPDGGITEIAPYTGIADRGYGGQSGPLGWELAFPYLQKQLYDYYGDRRIIKQNYEAFKKQMEFLQSKAINSLFYWDISDHEALDTKPEALTASAFYYHHTILAAEFAGILDKKDDSIKYAKLAKEIKEVIVSKYWIPNTGRFDNATQSAQIFALWYNLTPQTDFSLQILINELARHKLHISTGIFATKMLFDVLSENKLNQVAYTIADQKTFPGWGYMLSKGATTLWETWAYPDNAPSQNHPMFGSVDEWFYHTLTGINAAAPGFKKILIKPQPATDLRWAKGSYESVYGKIISDWKKDNESYILYVSIPVNTTAEVWIPSKENSVITEGGKSISNKEIKFVRYQDGYAVVETGSGEYTFRSE